MFFRLSFNFLLLVAFTFYTCDNQTYHSSLKNKSLKTSIKYAKHFGIIHHNNKKTIWITENNKDTLFYEITRPYSKLVVLGTIPAFQLSLLNALSNIVAIDDVKYYNHSKIKALVANNKIFQVLPNLQWNYEMLLQVQPDIIITYSHLNENAQLQNILNKFRIQQVLYLDYLEQHPLGRAEWIKVLGCLIDNDSLAEKIFSDIEQQYLQLKQMTDTCQNRPSVFTEVMYGDAWYIAGNQSYIAQLIKDAGGHYVFDIHQYENSRPYSFEYVLKYAQNADFWLHTQHFRSLQQMKNNHPKYSLFKAFKNKNCFNNDKIRNEFGFNDYYESGICQPHLVLKDLIHIIHPEILPNHTLSYYYQLSEQ